jgi:hypothetical protein
MSIFLIEVIVASLLYIPKTIFSNLSIRELLLIILNLNFFRFIYYYWLLFIIYQFIDINKQMQLVIYNVSVFIFLSIFFSVLVDGASELFLEYSFVCNLTAICFAPKIFGRLDLIYNNKT